MTPVLLIRAKLWEWKKVEYTHLNSPTIFVIYIYIYIFPSFLPVGLDAIVYVNADVVGNALFFLFTFIANILCVSNKLIFLSKLL